MSFVFYSNEAARPNEKEYVTADKQGRLYISRLAQKRMDAEVLPLELYIAYSAVTKEIAFTKNAPEGMKPFRFNGNRAYASAKTFLMNAGIMPGPTEDAHRYFYSREENGLYIFVREGFEPRQEEDVDQMNIDDALEHIEETPEHIEETPKEDEPPKEESQVEESSEFEPVEGDAELHLLAAEIARIKKDEPKISQKNLADACGVDRNRIRKALRQYPQLKN